MRNRVFIGEIHTEADWDKLAAVLRPCYEYAQWKWASHLNADARHIPARFEIAIVISKLCRDATAHGTVETGGLMVSCKDGLLRLYADHKLFPKEQKVTG